MVAVLGGIYWSVKMVVVFTAYPVDTRRTASFCGESSDARWVKLWFQYHGTLLGDTHSIVVLGCRQEQCLFQFFILDVSSKIRRCSDLTKPLLSCYSKRANLRWGARKDNRNEMKNGKTEHTERVESWVDRCRGFYIVRDRREDRTASFPWDNKTSELPIY